VPRDLWVPIPGYGEERINAAYALGGAQSAKTAMTNTVGVPIDRYLIIGLQSVRDVVNAVGGIDITVDEAIYDPAYPTDDYGIVEVRIPAGRQRMDGETALRYARTRHQDSDFGRIARQQKVFNALRNEMLKPQSWPRVPAALAAFVGGSKTDLQPFDYIAISAAFLRDFGEPQRLVLDANYVEPFTGAGGAALLAPRSNLRAGVARFLGNTTPRVEVLNGTSVPGAARNAADRLSRGGYEIVNIGDADAQTSDTTIIVRPESRRLADGVISTLGASTQRTLVNESNNLPQNIDMRVIVGRDMTV
jgi:LCP family protein required for cell wall assembly